MAEIIDDNYETLATHQDASVWPTATTWGLISAGVGFVLLLLQYLTGSFDIDPDTGQPAGGVIWTLLGYGVTIALIYFGLRTYRDKDNEGHLSLGKGVVWSLAFGLIGGLLGAVLVYIMFAFIAPDILETMRFAQEAILEEQGLSGQELESAMQMSGMFVTPVSFALFGLLGSVIGSAIIGLIVSLFLKTT